MRDMNRRAVMAGVAAATVVPAGTLVAAGADPIFAAIEKHRA
jgi:hypothetical protein